MTAEFAREALRSSEASRPGIGRVTEPLAGPVANSSRPNPFAGPPVVSSEKAPDGMVAGAEEVKAGGAGGPAPRADVERPTSELEGLEDLVAGGAAGDELQAAAADARAGEVDEDGAERGLRARGAVDLADRAVHPVDVEEVAVVIEGEVAGGVDFAAPDLGHDEAALGALLHGVAAEGVRVRGAQPVLDDDEAVAGERRERASDPRQEGAHRGGRAPRGVPGPQQKKTSEARLRANPHSTTALYVCE